MLPDGFGFLRAPEYNYLPGQRHLCFAVANSKFDLRRRYGQRPGASPKDGERYFALIKVEAVNFEDPRSREQIFFDN